MPDRVKKSRHPTKLGGHEHCESRDRMVLVCRVGYKTLWVGTQHSELPFCQVWGGHSQSGRGVIIILVSHVISQNQVIKGSCNHPAKFGGHRHCCREDMMFSVVERQDSTCPR